MKLSGEVTCFLFLSLVISGCAVQASKGSSSDEETFALNQNHSTPFTSTEEDEVIDEIPIDNPVEESSEAPLVSPPETEDPTHGEAPADNEDPIYEETLSEGQSPVGEEVPTDEVSPVAEDLPKEIENEMEEKTESIPPPSLEELKLLNGETVVVKTLLPSETDQADEEDTRQESQEIPNEASSVIEEEIPPAPTFLVEVCYKARLLRHQDATREVRISIFRKADKSKKSAIYTETVDLSSDRRELSWYELPYFENPDNEAFVLEVSRLSGDSKNSGKISLGKVSLHSPEDCQRPRAPKKKQK